MMIDIQKFCNRTKIAVIGDVMLDRYINGIAERISPEAPIPVVEVQDIKNIVGGAANVMSNIAGLGSTVLGFGVVGDDDDARVVISDLKKRGIDTTHILVDRSRPTTSKCRIMVGHHQMMRYDIEKKNSIPMVLQSKIIDGLEQAASEVQMLVISDYNKGVLSPELIRPVLSICKRNNIGIIVDPKVKNIQFYKDIKCLKINLHNAQKITDIEGNAIDEIKNICIALSKIANPQFIVLTMGKDGLVIFNKNKLTHIPALARDVYDVTGAGDVMTATLAISLANNYDIQAACYISTIAAALKVSKVGTYSLTMPELVQAVDLYNGRKV